VSKIVKSVSGFGIMFYNLIFYLQFYSDRIYLNKYANNYVVLKKGIRFMKRCLYVLLTLLFATVLVACGGNGSNEQTGGDLPADATMQICVGSESVWYYQGILNDYVKENNLPFKIKVTGVDTGKYTDTFLLDTTRGADIFVTAHDNLGKLLAGSGTIAPVTDEDLVANIEDTIDPIFQDVIYMSAAGGQSEFYAVPIIKQALVLFYNKDYLSDSDVVSWERF
jgi:maltose-binding protein MalE